MFTIKLKKIPAILVFLITTMLYAEEPVTKFKLYGFISNEFFYNSRQNVESIDGVFNYFPKPIELSNGMDKNAVPQAEMISINTRVGIDITGNLLFGAKSSGKIEADFAGFSTSYYVFRIRQAYMKLNWDKSELLIGQTWHPMFTDVIPTTLSANAGAPFNPFNRSPQIRLIQKINSTLALTAAAIYEMQYVSQGPLGASNTYLKNAIIPDLFVGFESKTAHWTNGIGADLKTIKPDLNSITSFSATAFSQYVNSNFELKAKATFGENLTDQGMLGGYGVSKFATDSSTVLKYTNLNNLNVWINAVYGTKIQVGAIVGLSHNLDSNEGLDLGKSKKITVYGNGFYCTTQEILNRLVRFSPQISYNLPNLKFGIEYDLTKAQYGKIQKNASISNPYIVDNNRIVASIYYYF